MPSDLPAASFFSAATWRLGGRRRYPIKIEDKSYVVIDYRLSLESGEEIESSEAAGEPLDFITGTDQIIPGLEKALAGMAVGDSSKIVVDPEDAYGPIDSELIQEVPREAFPDDVEITPGMSFEADGPDGPFMVTVSAVGADDTVSIDLNHPLAGKKLVFDIKVLEVRKPTEEELAQAADGCGCHGSDQPECGCGCGAEGSAPA